MDELTRTMAASASGMAAQAARLRLSSENIANVDTPGYHRKTVSFETEFAAGTDARAVRTGPVRLDARELARVYDPSHPLAGEDGSYRGSNVEHRRRDRRCPRGRTLLRGQPPPLRPGPPDGELAPRPPSPLESRRPMDIKATLASQIYNQVRAAVRPEPRTEAARTAGEAFQGAAADFLQTLRQGEETVTAGLAGRADPQAVVEALAATELAVQTAVAVRDKVVEAYQEILRMPV